jgi:hypothetical protein
MIRAAALGTLAAGLSGCIYAEPPRHRVVEREVVVEQGPYDEREVVVTDGPPPPERVEVVTVRPYPEAIWIRGHWDWVRARRGWFWARGHWR